MKKLYIIIAFLILCFWKGVIADGITPKIIEIDEEYSTENSDVEEITPTKAVVISNKGLYMYTGPLGREAKKDTYLEWYQFKRILTIPQNSTIMLTHKLDEGEIITNTNLWYYAEYSGKKGWIQYFDGNIKLYEEVDKAPEEKEPEIVQPQPTIGENKAPTPIQSKSDNNKAENNTKTIIICILSSIVGAFICLIILKLTNRKPQNKE